ncbi:MAG TPA: ABC transporter permease subunit [bacterium]|nr:ABC transporter permease subunit [bacterium]
MNRFNYFIKRFLLIPPTLLGITVICFAISQFVPGGPVEQIMLQMRGIGGDGSANSSGITRGLTEEHKKNIEKHFGFDKPVHIRYLKWLKGVLKFDFGDSYKYPDKTAWKLIKERFPVSLIFGITGFILQYLICIPLGVRKAVKHGESFDLTTSVIIFIGYSTPAFALGMILKMLFCGSVEGLWDWFPLTGFISENFSALSLTEKIFDVAKHMVLPIICYMIDAFAVLTILMKNSLLEQISSDYIRTAMAKGCSFNKAVFGHALRNSLIPIATGFGSFMTLMFAGSVLIEKVFEIPGMGMLALDAITSRDYNVFMGIIVVQSFLGLIGNIASDVCYVWIDPRISFEKN